MKKKLIKKNEKKNRRECIIKEEWMSEEGWMGGRRVDG